MNSTRGFQPKLYPKGRRSEYSKRGFQPKLYPKGRRNFVALLTSTAQPTILRSTALLMILTSAAHSQAQRADNLDRHCTFH